MSLKKALLGTGEPLLVFVNMCLWACMLLGPLLFPATSNRHHWDSAVQLCAMVFFYGLIISMNLNLFVYTLTEKEEKRRRLLLHYMPLWAIPLFIITIQCLTVIIWHTLPY